MRFRLRQPAAGDLLLLRHRQGHGHAHRSEALLKVGEPRGFTVVDRRAKQGLSEARRGGVRLGFVHGARRDGVTGGFVHGEDGRVFEPKARRDKFVQADAGTGARQDGEDTEHREGGQVPVVRVGVHACSTYTSRWVQQHIKAARNRLQYRAKPLNKAHEVRRRRPRLGVRGARRSILASGLQHEAACFGRWPPPQRSPMREGGAAIPPCARKAHGSRGLPSRRR